MVTINAIIKRGKKKEYVVIPYDEFLKVQEELHNYEDIRCLREAKESEKMHRPSASMNLKNR